MMGVVQSREADALAAQLGDLVALVDDISDENFSRPTRCPGWSVAELVAHCEGILLRLVGENAKEVDGEAEIDRVGYYRYEPEGPREGDSSGKTFSEVIRDRVIDEVAGRKGDELRVALEEAVDGAVQGIREIPAERVIERSGHPRISYGEFVTSRNLEFGVHTMDIADAVGRAQVVHSDAAPIITGMLDGLLGSPVPAQLGWDDTTYILTGTGRRQLTEQERLTLGPLASRFPLLR